ncbi:hypothetical protein [Alienimonas chondri]|uniref:Uncharacterized protein n=1 Tax=Alienimonas chondri TaxID=2681879 RepID=A0ABX1VB75_9PLAN|nr:hypothetical protein [Alienimonas chondri]NNJ25360.1 hypothetical protein [Alienimonas chondri]
MARTESDREDLFAEAVALRRRVEFVVPGLPGAMNPVVAGVHRDGRVSMYCGGAAADHFDPSGRLTRSFAVGANGVPRLYRSQGDTLAELIRECSADRTTLVRRDLPTEELAAALQAIRDRLRTVAAALADGSAEPLRITDDDPRADLAAFFATALPADTPLAPRFKGKR